MKPFSLTAMLGLAFILAACGGSGAPSPVATAQPAPPAQVVAASAVEPAPVSPKPSQESLTIDFDAGGTTLSPVASAQLDGAGQLYRDAGPEVMIISGHSDKTGREFENLILSARRAAVVKKALVDRGIPAERLQIIAIGEAEPVAKSLASRTAVVTWR